MRRAMELMEGLGLQVPPLSNEYHTYDHPYFGWIFLALVLKLIGYPSLLNPSVGDLSSIQDLYLVPRALMGLIAVVDTLLVYKISEHRYNRNVAFVASVLFAVMPMTWLLRRILLDSILLPFLLSSIFFAIKFKESVDSNKKHDCQIELAVLSGIFMGIAIFTKIPAFTFLPLLLYLVTINDRSKNWRSKVKILAILSIPIVLIPAIWPLYAIEYGQFDEFLEGIETQSTRNSKPLFEPTISILEIDPVLIIIGSIGGIYTTVRKDLFFVLWVFPYILFLYFINYSQYIHIVLLFPVFCITAAILLDSLSTKLAFLLVQIQNVRSTLRTDRKLKLQRQITDFLDEPRSRRHPAEGSSAPSKVNSSLSANKISMIIISIVGIFGLVITTTLISADINKSFFEAYASFVDYLPQNSEVTMMAPQKWGIYFLWIPKYIFDKEITFLKDGSNEIPQTSKIISIGSEHNASAITADSILNKIIGRVSNTARDYDWNKYPYSNMRYNDLADITIRANY
jgi:hypothetical protein